jgi:hypothetical protein
MRILQLQMLLSRIYFKKMEIAVRHARRGGWLDLPTPAMDDAAPAVSVDDGVAQPASFPKAWQAQLTASLERSLPVSAQVPSGASLCDPNSSLWL